MSREKKCFPFIWLHLKGFFFFENKIATREENSRLNHSFPLWCRVEITVELGPASHRRVVQPERMNDELINAVKGGHVLDHVAPQGYVDDDLPVGHAPRTVGDRGFHDWRSVDVPH